MVTLNSYFEKIVKDKIVVDLGCAGYRGKYSDRANILNAHSKEWYGGDINTSFIKRYEDNKNLFYTDLNHPNFFKDVPKEIEVITLIDVIEHLENPYGLLKYIYENKQPETELLVAVPNSLSFGKVLFGLFSKTKLLEQDKYHLHAFNEGLLINTFKRIGYTEYDVVPYVKEKRMLLFMKYLPNFSSGLIIRAK